MRALEVHFVCGSPYRAHLKHLKQQTISRGHVGAEHSMLRCRSSSGLHDSSHSTRPSTSSNSSRPFTADTTTRNSPKPDLLLLRMLGLTTMPQSSSSGSSRSSSSSSGPNNQPKGLSNLRQGVINPDNPVYKAWRGLLIGAAAFTGVFVPWELGFSDLSHFYSLDNCAAWIDLALVTLFMTDIGVSHFVAYETDELIIDEPGAIAANYRRQRLALDLISAVPFDWIVYGLAAAVAAASVATGPDGHGLLSTAADASIAAAAATAESVTAAAAAAGGGLEVMPTAAAAAAAGGGGDVFPAIACLKALHLVRLYRVRWFFRYLEYDLTVSLLTVTVARNLVIVLYLTHWVACGFNFLARSEGYDPDLLVGLNPQLFASISEPEQYLYSLYWSVTTLAGNEWNGMDSVHDMRQVVANTFRASVFLLFNIALGAYILGTITLLVVKNDERTGRYRDLSSNLKTYSLLHQLPAELKDEMQEHLRLKFNNQEASDDQVLSIYPTTIRRRILRHLYLRHLRGSYLFRGSPRKYLDALLSASRLELFRPGVDLLAAGDAVNELFVVVAGKVELRSPLDPSVSQYDWGGDYDTTAAAAAADSLSSLDPLSSMMGEHEPDLHTAAAAGAGAGFSVYAGPSRVLGPGELFGEISFFTEIPQMETVRSLSTVRVMVISRSAFESIERNFPIATRLVLENLKRHSEQQVSVEFPGVAGSQVELQQLLATCPSSLMYSWASPELVELMISAESPAVPDDLEPDVMRYSTISSIGSLDDSTTAAPAAASSSHSASSSSSSRGGGIDTDKIMPADAAVAARGSSSQLYLGSSSSSKLSARQELVLSNLVRVLAVINQHLAKQDEDRTTDFLYAATRGDVVKIRAMLQQGFNPDSADYDGRTALMLSCVRGHRDVVELLLAGGADAELIDNMGRSALLEACYHGHDNIIDILAASGVRLTPTTPSGSSSGGTARLTASSSATSNISGSSSSGRNTTTAAAASYGGLSAAAGAGGVVHSARRGSETSWGLQLASLLCNCVYECNLPLLRRLLRAGAPVDIGDYDRRTPLHISAAEGNLVMLRVLVEEGGANLHVLDRWGNSPLDEARRVGAQMVVSYLEIADKTAAAAAAAVEAAGGGGIEVGSSSGGAEGGLAATGERQGLERETFRLQQGKGLSSTSAAAAHNSPGGLRRSFTSSSSSSRDEAPRPLSWQQQQQADAAAELQRQQQLQAKRVREVRGNLNRHSRTERLARIDAVGQLLRLADETHQQLVVTAAEIDADLAERNAAKVVAPEDSSGSSSKNAQVVSTKHGNL